ncbi:MAG: LPS export ABC transporter periplasmic protein LptC [Mariprofundaceae bacterium]|nr:LPS export ABC transporter periplasmic protein LptC [Mariprofundaceae bacterium]
MVGKQSMRAWHWRYLKWGCLIVSIGSMSIAAGFMWSHNNATTLPKETADTGEAASTRVEKPLIVERKDERIIWRLKAESAKQHENTMQLVTPVLELFTETNEVITVHGNQAWFEPLKRNIHFKGSVSVTYRDWLLLTNSLYFDSTHNEVIVPNTFTATGPHTIFKGRGLKADRKTQILHVAHDVWVKDSQPERLGGLP